MDVEHLMWLRFQREQQAALRGGVAMSAHVPTQGVRYPGSVGGSLTYIPPMPNWNPQGQLTMVGTPTTAVRVGRVSDHPAPPPPVVSTRPPPKEGQTPKATVQLKSAKRKHRTPVRTPTAGSTPSDASLSPALGPKRPSAPIPRLDLNEDDGDGEELDNRRLNQRQKQINFGKVTEGYRQYRNFVPPWQRQQNNPNHPDTPRVRLKCSKRRWDTMVATWRRALHSWDGDVNPAKLTQSHAPTLEELGLATRMPLDQYVQDTERELATVRIAIKRMQEGKTPQYPGETMGEPEPDSNSDPEPPVVRVVRASSAKANTDVDVGPGAPLEVSDPHALPFVPSPIEHHPTSDDRVELASQQPTPLHFVPNLIMLKVIQRKSSTEENVRTITVSSAGEGLEGIHGELRRRFNGRLHKVFFQQKARGRTSSSNTNSMVSAAPGPSPGVAKPQPFNPADSSGGEMAEAVALGATSSSPMLCVDSLDNLRILVQQPFAPNLYFLSDSPLPDEDLDVEREMQLTPTKWLYANSEQMYSDLVFTAGTLHSTPTPFTKASTLSPTHFYDQAPKGFVSQQRALSDRRPSGGSLSRYDEHSTQLSPSGTPHP